MTRAQRAAALVGCAVVAVALAWYAGSRFAPGVPAPPAGTVALGPEAGEGVAQYLARLPAQLPPSGAVAPALVQFGTEQSPAAALDAVAGTTPVVAVLRVPLPRVQTALRFEAVEAAVPAPVALDSARRRALSTARTDATRLVGRPRAVATAEAAALANPTCACVLALVVRADRAELAALAARPEVRAVHAGPPDATARELALSPLLPEQTVRADPPPDDGVVPPS